MKKIDVSIRKCLIIIFTMMIIFVSINNIFVDGKYNWHVHQPSFYLSGLQCVAFLGVTYLCSLAKKEHTSEILFFFGGVFLLMQGVIVPYIVVYLYFEIICFIGFVICSKIFRESNIIINFISGLSIWGAGGIAFSLADHGTINDLRILTLLLLGICILINNRKYKFMPQILSDYIKRNEGQNLAIFLIFALSFLSLIMAAKSNAGQDFDSIWYMLKPEYMLVGEKSFYEYLGYSAFVHYYPKLVEFFFLPVSGLGDYSFLLIANVFVYNLFVVLLYSFFSFLCEECPEWLKLLFLVVLFTVPSLTSVVPSVKGDNFGAFLTMSGFFFLLQFVKKEERKLLLFSFLCLFLCTGTKLTFLMWGGIIGIVGIVYGTLHLRKDCIILQGISFNKSILLLSFCSIFFVFGIHLRTYLLTGYPIFPIMIDFWKKLGFKTKYAIRDGDVAWGVIPKSERISRLYSFFFSPNDLSHTIMCWPTNLILILGIILVIVFIGRKIKIDSVGRIMLIISVLEMLFAFNYLLTMQQPDGNYFFLPFLIFLLTCIYLLYSNKVLISEVLTKKIIVSCAIVILTLNIPLMFVSSWSWAIGIEPFSTNIVGDNFSDYKKDKIIFNQGGYLKIAEYIENEFGKRRVIASNDANRIKGAVEITWSAFADCWCSSEIIGSYDNFRKYVEYANIEGFLLLNSDDSFFKDYVNQLVKECKIESIIEDDGGVFYVVNYQ